MRRAVSALVAVIGLIPGAALAQAAAATSATAAVAPPGAFLFDSRTRYEAVRQDGLDDADALTTRLRLGWRSPTVSGFTVLVEGEAVQALVDDFNDTIHGPPTRAVVADPDTLELNRLQVTWTGVPDTEVTLGRQRIVFGNARYVGNVGFRQNEQTFDAVRVTTTAFKPFSLTYAYIDRVHRVFGDDSPVGEWRSDSHLIHAETPTPAGRLSVDGAWLDFENAPGQSSATVGARLAGSRAVAQGWSLNWVVEYARQTEYGANSAQFDLDYGQLAAGVTHGPVTVTLARERLDGNGVRGFQTPLATLHAFQGWADVFLTTPARGLTDDSITVAHVWSDPPVGRQVLFSGAWHDFSDSDGDRDFGSEFDVSARLILDARWAVEAKTALFDGAGPFADRDKLWMALEYKF